MVSVRGVGEDGESNLHDLIQRKLVNNPARLLCQHRELDHTYIYTHKHNTNTYSAYLFNDITVKD